MKFTVKVNPFCCFTEGSSDTSTFEPFIAKLKDKYQVVCIATRGHGKSEMGNAPYTFDQRANDVFQVIQSITRDSVIVLGFSDGGYSGFKLAANYPQVVKKLVSIGASDRPNGGEEKSNYTRESLMEYSGDFFRQRLALMPEPERWDESLSRLNDLYNKERLSKETFEKIECPVLVMSGDHDGYHSVDAVARAAKYIEGRSYPSSRVAITLCSFVTFQPSGQRLSRSYRKNKLILHEWPTCEGMCEFAKREIYVNVGRVKAYPYGIDSVPSFRPA